MDAVIFMKLVAILLLVVGNAFFVGSEVAITAARRSRIKQLADMGDKRAAVVKLLHDEPTRFYAVTQIGITLVSMALGYIGMDAFKVLMSPWFESFFGLFMGAEAAIHWGSISGLTMGFIIISFLHVVGGELAPKVLAYHKSEQMSCALGWMINGLYIAWTPIIWVMNHASNWLLIAVGHGDIVKTGEGGGHGHDSSTMSAEELSMVVNASSSSGAIPQDQGRMLIGVFDLEEEIVEEAMVPKPDVEGIPHTATISDTLDFFSRSKHHCYPVFEGDKIIGSVLTKRLLFFMEKNKADLNAFISRPITEIMRSDPFIFPTGTKLSQAWKDFRDNRRQLGIVVDEYGSAVGILTPADIISRLTGEFPHDEFSPRSEKVHKLEGSQWELAGSARLADLEQLLNFPFPKKTGHVTIGGLVFNKLGRVPETGDVVQLENGRIQILEIKELRIIKVLFQIMKLDSSGNWVLDETDSPEAPPLEEKSTEIEPV
ncbi:MAG: HlyC/CorC family transporter [Magnetococcales bacterium]|nr:HlyC/CorC family transporter [Magnetococcales bacterium]